MEEQHKDKLNKGKGHSIDTPEVQSSTAVNGAEVAATPSIASRIGSSASSLARDLFNGTASSASTTTSNLASLGSSEKASASRSSASSSSWAQNGIQPGSSASHPSSEAAVGQNNSFRELRPTSLDNVDPMSFEEARLNQLVPDSQNYTLDQAPSESKTWTEQFREESEDLQYVWSRRTAKGKGKEVSGDVAIATNADGLEVVDLLNDFTSTEDDPSLSHTSFESIQKSKTEPSADDLFGEPLSSSEMEIRDQILATLPRPREYQEQDPDSLNNFRPNVEMLHMPATEAATYLAMYPSKMHFSSQEQRREWMKQWVDEWDGVLHGYIDEVWGTKLPNVQEAKQEIAALKKDESRLDDIQALRRLKMILGHIQVPGVG